MLLILYYENEQAVSEIKGVTERFQPGTRELDVSHAVRTTSLGVGRK